MFSWFRRKPPAAQPPAPVAAPGAADADTQNADKPLEATDGRVTFTNDQRTWEESFDCATSLLETLRRQGRSARAENRRILDEASGLWLSPVLVDFQPIHDQGVRTCTKINITHPTAIPQPVFEYQHSTGATMTESLEAGFDSWSKSDLPTLADATREKPLECATMIVELPAQGDRLAMKRRAIYGPVAHFRQNPAATEEAHPFCPCCLFTRSINTFKSMLESDGFFALRLYAARGSDHVPAADCRVNGEEFEPGKEALRQYASTWPNAGIEFRKQYVIIQRAPLSHAEEVDKAASNARTVPTSTPLNRERP